MIFKDTVFHFKKRKRLYLLFPFLYLVLSCTSSENENTGTVNEQADSLSGAISTPAHLSEMELSMQSQGLVDIQSIDPSIRVDLKYSSTDNFFGKDIYGDSEKAFLQEKPAIALKLAQYLLKKQNPDYSLLVYDAARPLRVQRVLWESLDSIPSRNRKNFVADPEVGSIHNYGCAVDLTIVDLTTNQALDMGTPFDYFGHLAYPRKENQMLNEGKLNQKQIENRLLLRNIMHTTGYDPITSEWWHFNFYSLNRAKNTYKIIE